MRDATIRLQDIDGTWTTLGTDRASAIYAVGLNLTSNDWGPDTATFELHRDPSASWPDLGAFTPVEIEVGNQMCWSGRIAETQVQDGSTRQLSVRCEGRQYCLDDDQFARTYYTRAIGDWQPITDYVPVGTDWVGHGGTVDVRDGSIWMGWRAGSVMRTGDMLGLVLDLGAKADYGFGRLSAFGEMHMEGFKYPLSTTKGNYGTYGVGYITTGYGNDTNGPASPSNQNNSSLPVSAWSSGVSYAPGDVVSYNASVLGGYQQVYIKQTGTGASATTPPNDTNWFQVRNPISVWVEFFPDLGSLYSAAQGTRQDFIDNYESVFGFNKAVATTDAAAAQSCSAMMSTGLASNDGSLVRPSAANQGKNIKQAAFWKTASNSARYCLIAMSTSGYGKVGTIATGAIRDVQPLPNSYGLNLGGLALTSSYTNSQTPNLDPTTNSYADIVGSVASALKASAVVRAAVSRAAPSLTTRQVQDTSLNLQHVKTDGFKTPREVIQDVNAFHGWVSRVDADGDLVFKPQPTAPRFELGSWSGYEFTDQAASSGEDIYSRVIVEGLDPFGQLNQVVRTAAQVATSVRLSTPGASTLTADQQQGLNVVSVRQGDVVMGTPNGKIPVDIVNTATAQQLAQLTPAGSTGVTTVTAAAVSVSGVFRAGVTYEFTGSINIDGSSFGDPPQDFLLRFGNDGYAIGTSTVVETGITQALTTETYTNVVRLTASNSGVRLEGREPVHRLLDASDRSDPFHRVRRHGNCRRRQRKPRLLRRSVRNQCRAVLNPSDQPAQHCRALPCSHARRTTRPQAHLHAQHPGLANQRDTHRDRGRLAVQPLARPIPRHRDRDGPHCIPPIRHR